MRQGVLGFGNDEHPEAVPTPYQQVRSELSPIASHLPATDSQGKQGGLPMSFGGRWKADRRS